MRALIRSIGVSGACYCFVAAGSVLHAGLPHDHGTIVITSKTVTVKASAAGEIARIDLKAAAIVYKDGHKEKISAEIDRIEFGEPDVTAATAWPKSFRRQMGSRRGQRRQVLHHARSQRRRQENHRR